MNIERHPSDDPRLPSFECSAYQEIIEDLGFVNDVFDGLKCCVNNRKITNIGKLQQYFPKERHEPQSSYTARMTRSAFDNRFTPAIKGFAGILPIESFSDDIFSGITENEEDVDLEGNNMDAFWSAADERALKDGAVGILVEFPRQPRNDNGEKMIQTAADEKRYNLRPYLCLIERKNILSWRSVYVAGKMAFSQIVIREQQINPIGVYGEDYKIHYRVLRPGSFEVWELTKTKEDWVANLIEEGSTSLPTIPLVMYSISDICPFDAEPPFKTLAELNVSYHDLYLGYRELIHKLHIPVPVRKGLIMAGQKDFSGLPPLIIGPNSCVDIASDGDFFFAEPSGNSLKGTREELDKLKTEMASFTLGFLSAELGVTNRTATEAQLIAGSTQANLAGMARLKESAIEEVFRLWAAYYGQPNGGSASVNKDILQIRLDPQIVQVYSNLCEKGQVSLMTFLKMLKEGKVLPRDVEPLEEAEEIQRQVKLEVKERNDGDFNSSRQESPDWQQNGNQ